MPATDQQIIDLETRFWQSMVDDDTATAESLMTEPSMLVSGHGAMRFGRADYRRMAKQAPMVVKSFAFSDMQVAFPSEDTAVLSYHVKQGIAPRGTGQVVQQDMLDTSTWVRTPDGWQCALHTETPMEAQRQH